MRSILNILILAAAIVFCSCRSVSAEEPSGPIKIIFDTDMGSDCDDAGALALLHTYADEGKAEIIACIYSSGKVPYGAAVIQAINIYYNRPDIPVGACHDAVVGDPKDKMTAEKLARDRDAFGHTIIHNHDAPEQTQLNRRILAQQPDHSVVYLTVGHTKGLYDLLVSDPDEICDLSGQELIRKKVKCWIALGALRVCRPEAGFRKDYNFCFNGTVAFTKYVVENLPIRVYFVDAGTDVLTGKSLKDAPPGSIVRTAYRDWLWNYGHKTLDDQRPSWDLAAVYYAVQGTGRFLKFGGFGTLTVDIEKGCRWASAGNDDAGTDQVFILQKEGVADAFAAYLNERIAGKPKTKD